ncbi:PREDICTED: intracellular protein transport protein USO1-like [Nicotiana attenuata]|uniref:Protein crowded nuclei 1 n=1 Tax=Nicotiana attenuata TaxID=49451 RepID=A0A1J6IBI7_NICAT|nr:PREDICTED: intracellular protein transport protein USO1-like [Nicotiana attenuata]OIT02294.1 protein crowded nuclei 1 [Nicotiana attenuata]
MTKRSWKEAMKAFGSHIDLEKEEQLKWTKIEIENKVKRIAKLIKRLNQGSREGNLKRRSELLQLVDEFHKQYQSLYSMYDNLKGEVRKKLNEEHEGDLSSQSSSCSNSELYYTPEEMATKSNSSCSNCESLDVEDAILKDKITSKSEVKVDTMDFDVEKFETPMSFGRVSEPEEFFKDLRIQGEEKLINESTLLKEKVKEKEDEISSITDKFELREKERLSQMKGLEDQVATMKLELENLCVRKGELEDQIVCKSNEVKRMEESNSRLQARVLELQATFRKKDDQFSQLLKKFKENQQKSKSRIDDLMSKSTGLQKEVDRLHAERNELEEKLLHETKKGSDQVKDVTERTQFLDLTERTDDYLQHELEALRNQKYELELSLKEKTQEVSECKLQIENMKVKLTSTTLSEEGVTKEKEGLNSEVKSLAKETSDLKEKIMDMNQEAYHLELQKEKLNDKIMELETKLLGKEAEVGILQKKLDAYMNDMSTQNSKLTARISTAETEKTRLKSQLEKEKHEFSQSLKQMEKKNTELTIKIAEQEKNIRGMEIIVNKSKEEHKQMQIRLEESKSNFQNAEKKLEEMTEELRKMFEDSLRILSRRIRVAEQLHIENKEWYQKTRNSYEKENKDLKEKNARHEMGLRGIKDISLTASDMLGSLDAVALNFEECTAHFLNRISKVSCELKFVKDWVMRKNKATAHVKDDFDCLLTQCDDKEAEILKYRERVWKLENKVRELEKTIKDQEESMLVLKEEKREAIRQLCVWIDYHRSRSDYYKRILLTEFSRRSAP